MTYETISAEREGFEPPEVLPSTVFKTAAIDRSAISPNRAAKVHFFWKQMCVFLGFWLLAFSFWLTVFRITQIIS